MPLGKRFIFGVNYHSRALAKIIDVAGFIDEFSSLKIIDGIRIYKNFSQINSDCIVINASTMKPHLSSLRLNSMGILNLHVFNLFEHRSNFQEEMKYDSSFRVDFSNNYRIYNEIRNAMSDEQSKMVFDVFTNSRLTGNINNNFTLLK